mmetsp:Transcript_24148/g.60296  ORF Transcript_24148/g.60296 Transcript_24148/m.60296 type:complete len:638 (-) Transcript_24148:85-1998(-)
MALVTPVAAASLSPATVPLVAGNGAVAGTVSTGAFGSAISGLPLAGAALAGAAVGYRCCKRRRTGPEPSSIVCPENIVLLEERLVRIEERLRPLAGAEPLVDQLSQVLQQQIAHAVESSHKKEVLETLARSMQNVMDSVRDTLSQQLAPIKDVVDRKADVEQVFDKLNNLQEQLRQKVDVAKVEDVVHCMGKIVAKQCQFADLDESIKKLEQDLHHVMTCLSDKASLELVDDRIQDAKKLLQDELRAELAKVQKSLDGKADADLIHDEMTSMKANLEHKADAAEIEGEMHDLRSSINAKPSLAEVESRAAGMEQNFEHELNRLSLSLKQKASSELIERSAKNASESVQRALVEKLDLVWKALEDKVDAEHVEQQMKSMEEKLGKKAKAAVSADSCDDPEGPVAEMRKNLEQKINLIMLCLNEKPSSDSVDRSVQGAAASLRASINEELSSLQKSVDRKADTALLQDELTSMTRKLQDKADTRSVEEAVRGMSESILSRRSAVEAGHTELAHRVPDDELERLVAPVHQKMTADLIQKSTKSITKSVQQKLGEQLDLFRRSLEDKADTTRIEDQLGDIRVALQRKIDSAELDRKLRGIVDGVGDLTQGLKDSLAMSSACHVRPAQQAFPWDAFPMSVDG